MVLGAYIGRGLLVAGLLYRCLRAQRGCCGHVPEWWLGWRHATVAVIADAAGFGRVAEMEPAKSFALQYRLFGIQKCLNLLGGFVIVDV
jgi:hypothetical protein